MRNFDVLFYEFDFINEVISHLTFMYHKVLLMKLCVLTGLSVRQVGRQSTVLSVLSWYSRRVGVWDAATRQLP